MSNDAKIAALKTAASEKKQRAAENLEKAIRKLTQANQPITFADVARVAGLSVSYLYKYPEIKERIETLRKQQLRAGKPTEPQKASDNSKAAIIYQLRERIKQLEAEITGLRKVNEGIAGRLYHLQDATEIAERLKIENTELKQKLEECRRHPTSATPSELDDAKVTSLDNRRARQSNISDEIKRRLADLGIPLNSTLTKTLKNAPEARVLNAIEAFKEAMTSDNIEKPGAWLKQAIEEGWCKNEPVASQTVVETQKGFSEWFELARSQGIVKARQETEAGFMFEDSTGQWVSPQSLIERGWTLDYLRTRTKPR